MSSKILQALAKQSRSKLQWRLNTPTATSFAVVYLTIFSFRAFSAMFQKSFYVPDEVFQSLEIAYSLVFGQGQISWEWRAPYRIRSFLYPLYLSPGYWLVKALGLADTAWLIIVPRLQQALVAAACDLYTWRLAHVLFGPQIAKFALAASLLSWHNFFTLSRTISNSIEATFLVMGFYYWYSAKKQSFLGFVPAAICFGLATTFRVSSVIPICLQIIAFPGHNWHAFRRAFISLSVTAIFFILASVLVDTYMSRILLQDPTLPFRFSHWDFVRINVLEHHSIVFGTKPWYWYLLAGIPAISGLNLLFVPWLLHPGLGLLSRRTDVLIVGTLVSISFIPHKEIRFLLSILPFLLISYARVLNFLLNRYFWQSQSIPSYPHNGTLKPEAVSISKGKKTRRLYIYLFLCTVAIGNGCLAIYFSRTNNSAPIDAAVWLSANTRSVFSLAASYTLAGQSYFGPSMRFGYLTCDPIFTRGYLPNDINNHETVLPNLTETLQTWNWKDRWGFPEAADHIFIFGENYQTILQRNAGILTHYYECKRFAQHGDIMYYLLHMGDTFHILCKKSNYTGDLKS